MTEKKTDTERESTMTEFVKEHVDAIFQDYIPMESIKELPTNYLYVFGSIAEAFMLALFLYFVITSYQNGISQQFISLESNAGNCQVVTKPLTGTYLASVQGLWQGATNFNYNEALYSLEFSEFEVTDSQFAFAMNMLKDEVTFFGQFASNQNIAMNLVILMTAVLVYENKGKVQVASFTASPGIVFNRADLYSTISSPAGWCAEPSTTVFDISSASFSISYDYNSYERNCSHVADPIALGYYGFTSTFGFTVDMNSLVSALSVNLNFNKYANLEYVQPSSVLDASVFYFSYKGVDYKVQQIFDTRYPGMDPMVCLIFQSTGQIALCTLSLGNVFALPLLNHFGGELTDYNLPDFCNCSTDVGKSTQCNEFTLMPALLFLPNLTENYYENFFPLIDMVNSYTEVTNVNDQFFGMKPYYFLNEGGYKASFYSITGQINDHLNSTFEFCGFNCSLITLFTGDYFNQAISPYYYQLNNASCGDPFNVSEWDNLAENSPSPLTETYFSCVDNWYTSMFNALGISTGNTSIGVAFFSVILLPFIFFSLRASGYAPPFQEYSELEKRKAIEELALQLLRARDGKTRGMRSKGSIQKLSSDLAYAAERVGGYPDSDDEEDEEDSTPRGKSSRRKSNGDVAAAVKSPMKADKRATPKTAKDSDDSDSENDKNDGSKEASNRSSIFNRRRPSNRQSKRKSQSKPKREDAKETSKVKDVELGKIVK